MHHSEQPAIIPRDIMPPPIMPRPIWPVLVPWSSLPAVPFCAKTGTIRPPRPAASMAMLVSDAHANSPLPVKRFPKAGSRPGRGTRLEKPSSSELSFLGSTGRQPHHALGGRVQELLRQLLVIDSARLPRQGDRRDLPRPRLTSG